MHSEKYWCGFDSVLLPAGQKHEIVDFKELSSLSDIHLCSTMAILVCATYKDLQTWIHISSSKSIHRERETNTEATENLTL